MPLTKQDLAARRTLITFACLRHSYLTADCLISTLALVLFRRHLIRAAMVGARQQQRRHISTIPAHHHIPRSRVLPGLVAYQVRLHYLSATTIERHPGAQTYSLTRKGSGYQGVCSLWPEHCHDFSLWEAPLSCTGHR